jgi:S-adenosyl methyltransferase
VEERGVPPEVDRTVPSIARVYDYVLGGKQNFAVDRSAGDALLRAVPDTQVLAQDNRALLRRVVRHLVGDTGVRQILDIGSGLPTNGNVHEVAREIAPETRVVYVDRDPMVLAHARALLADDDSTEVITADIRDPAAIFDDPVTTRLIDFTAPVAVLISGVLHHFADADDPAGTACAVIERVPPGGYVFISNFLDDDEPRAKALEHAFLAGGLGTGRFRTWEEQRAFYTGLELIEPGLVYANDWRPDPKTPAHSPAHTLLAGAVGRRV